jgi:hypothetical protein
VAPIGNNCSPRPARGRQNLSKKGARNRWKFHRRKFSRHEKVLSTFLLENFL